MTTISPIEGRRGQAAIETALGLVLLGFVIAALVGFAQLFLGDMEMIKENRAEAGVLALEATAGDERESGAAGAIAARARPAVADYGTFPHAPRYDDPCAYVCEALPAASVASVVRDAAASLETVSSGTTRTFDVDLSVMGSRALFPRGFEISEAVYLPPMGGGR